MRHVFALVSVTIVLSMGGIAAAVTTDWATEPNGWQYCPDNNAAISLECQGGYCAEIRSECELVGEGVSSSEYRTDYYSEEDHRFYCAPGYVVRGFDIQGWDYRGDNISLDCVQVKDSQEQTCLWTPWISEEPSNGQPSPSSLGWSSPSNLVRCRDYLADSYIHGMECHGGWCDNMSLFCCNYEPITAVTIPMNTRVSFELDGTVDLVINDLTFGWPVTEIVIGIAQTDATVLDGITMYVDGAPHPLTGWWDQNTVIPFTGQTSFSLELDNGSAVNPRQLEIQWWAN